MFSPRCSTIKNTNLDREEARPSYYPHNISIRFDFFCLTEIITALWKFTLLKCLFQYRSVNRSDALTRFKTRRWKPIFSSEACSESSSKTFARAVFPSETNVFFIRPPHPHTHGVAICSRTLWIGSVKMMTVHWRYTSDSYFQVHNSVSRTVLCDLFFHAYESLHV